MLPDKRNLLDLDGSTIMARAILEDVVSKIPLSSVAYFRAKTDKRSLQQRDVSGFVHPLGVEKGDGALLRVGADPGQRSSAR